MFKRLNQCKRQSRNIWHSRKFTKYLFSPDLWQVTGCFQLVCLVVPGSDERQVWKLSGTLSCRVSYREETNRACRRTVQASVAWDGLKVCCSLKVCLKNFTCMNLGGVNIIWRRCNNFKTKTRKWKTIQTSELKFGHAEKDSQNNFQHATDRIWTSFGFHIAATFRYRS